jgi:tRNA dimethylallyltransferase
VISTTYGKKIALVGPTASGKTNLSLYLAERFNGEIVCADSRTIFRGMNIGTAKPTAAEKTRVAHHLLDVVDPGEQLSAAEFKRLAERAIADISARGKVPFLVGGSGLYVDCLLYDYQFPAEADENLRARLDQMDDEELLDLLVKTNPGAFESVDLKNRRRVIRAIETTGQMRSRLNRVAPGWLVLGLTMNKNVAQKSISSRVEKMLGEGFLDEVNRIGETYGWESRAMDIIGYRAMKEVVLGGKTLGEGVAEFVRGDMELYKKQVTWFKRNHDVEWLESPMGAERMVREFLGGAV